MQLASAAVRQESQGVYNHNGGYHSDKHTMLQCFRKPGLLSQSPDGTGPISRCIGEPRTSLNWAPIGPSTDWDQHEAVTREERKKLGHSWIGEEALAKCSKLDLSRIIMTDCRVMHGACVSV